MKHGWTLDLLTPNLLNLTVFIKPRGILVKRNVHETSKVFLVILAP